MKVVVNAAISADGKLSTVERTQIPISGDDDFDRVDALRARVDAVLVGSGTVQADDPSLLITSPDRIDERTAAGRPPHPARVVADSRARIPANAQILDSAAQTYVLVSKKAPQGRIGSLESANTDIIIHGDEQVDLPAAFESLEQLGINQLLIEGGGELLASVFEQGLADELTTYIGNCIIGGSTAPTLVDGSGFKSLEVAPELHLSELKQIDEGALLTWNVVGTLTD